MSLINEALKRAQRQRGDAPPGAAAPSPLQPLNPSSLQPVPPTAPPRRRPESGRQLGLPIAAAALLLVGGLVAVVYFRPSAPAPVQPPPPAPPVVAPPVETAKAVPTLAQPAPVPAATPPVVLPPAPAISVPVVAFPVQAAPGPAAVAPTPVPSPVNLVPPPAFPPVAVIVPTAPPPPATPAPDPRVNAFLDTLRVTAILPSPTAPKVLMNGEVYKLNDLVDRATGLRIIKITSALLTFRDSAGFEYTHEPHP